MKNRWLVLFVVVGVLLAVLLIGTVQAAVFRPADYPLTDQSFPIAIEATRECEPLFPYKEWGWTRAQGLGGDEGVQQAQTISIHNRRSAEDSVWIKVLPQSLLGGYTYQPYREQLGVGGYICNPSVIANIRVLFRIGGLPKAMEILEAYPITENSLFIVAISGGKVHLVGVDINPNLS